MGIPIAYVNSELSLTTIASFELDFFTVFQWNIIVGKKINKWIHDLNLFAVLLSHPIVLIHFNGIESNLCLYISQHCTECLNNVWQIIANESWAGGKWELADNLCKAFVPRWRQQWRHWDCWTFRDIRVFLLTFSRASQYYWLIYVLEFSCCVHFQSLLRCRCARFHNRLFIELYADNLFPLISLLEYLDSPSNDYKTFYNLRIHSYSINHICIIAWHFPRTFLQNTQFNYLRIKISIIFSLCRGTQKLVFKQSQEVVAACLVLIHPKDISTKRHRINDLKSS